MNPQYIRDDLLIGNFLAGKLGDEDQEEFLADYLGDPERLEQLRGYVRDRELAERFLRDELSDHERDAFEKLCIADSVLYDELIMTEHLQQGLHGLDAAGQLPAGGASRGWRGWLHSPQYAMAASILLVVSLAFSGLLLRDNLSLRGEQNFASVSTDTRLVPLVTTRGDATNTLPQPGRNEWTVLLVDPGLTYDEYRASVRRTGGDTEPTVWEQSGLELMIYEQLALGMPGSTLTPGDYEIVIEGGTEDGGYEHITAVPLSVVAADE
jgi:hypothetical protein